MKKATRILLTLLAISLFSSISYGAPMDYPRPNEDQPIIIMNGDGL